MRRGGPPRVAAWILGIVLHPDDRHHALGDLEEEFEQIRARDPRAANRWYWAQAMRALGPSAKRRMVRGPDVGGVASDVRFALRALRGRPRLVAVSVVTLGLGIGAATAIFSVADAVLLRPLPYPAADRLVAVWNTYDTWRGDDVLDPFWDRIALSYPEYTDWRGGQASFEEVAIYGTDLMALTEGGDPSRVTVGLASVPLFPLLGARAHVGRLLLPGEDGPAALRIAVLSYELWRDRYGSDVRMVGSSVTLDDLDFEVVGVLAPGFRIRPLGPFGLDASRDFRHDVWIPIGALGEDLDRGNHGYEALGLLREGHALPAAEAEAALFFAGANAAPGTRWARLAYRKAEEVGAATDPILLLLGGVALLLLIACGNVASLMLSEATSRTREIATRAALGAGRRRILRQLTFEGVILGVAGGAVGLAIARFGSGLLMRLAPTNLSLPHGVPLDLRVLTFALTLGAASGVLFGLAPALAIRRPGLVGALRGTSGVGTREGRRLQRSVVALQVAVSIVLLTSGSLLGRSLLRLEAIEPGFDAEGMLTARLSLPTARYTTEAAGAFFRELADGLNERTGVETTAVSAMPFSGRGGSSSFQIVGREVPDGQKQPEALRRTVLPEYHEVMRVPLVAGRYLDRTDRTFEAPVIVVSRAMADEYWPDGSALGARIFRDRREFEVVGVVGDVLHGDLAEAPRPTFYVPLAVAESRNDLTVAIRHGMTEDVAVALLRDAVWATDPSLPVSRLATASALLADSTRHQRFRTLLMIVFASVAVSLSAVGLFGVTTRAVTTRAPELGVRLALGARARGLVTHVIAGELPALLAGLTIGLVFAVAAGGLLARFLFEVAPRDPSVLAAAAGTLLVVGVAAILVAARRTLALDPVDVIRAD